MLWDLYQEGRILQAQTQANRAADGVDRSSGDIADLKKSVERLTLACQAMWEILRDSTTFTEEMLDQKMQEIDLRDGSKDNRISSRPVDCPTCGAKSNSKRENCIMCGSKLAKEHVFHG